MDSPSRPLVTFALFAYNQETYIREAVESALAQNYSPLEIILSDDASSDDTASIIREISDKYRGPNSIIVNINDSNLGIGAHVNKIFHMAKGELLIIAAGDDQSLPDRTRKTVEFWNETGRTLSAIFCGGQTMDSNGNKLGPVSQKIRDSLRDASSTISSIHNGHCIVLGACAAYAPNIMSYFGDLAPDLGIEDTPLAVRASLLGGIGYIEEALVHYRVNVSVWRKSKALNESFSQHIQRLAHLTQALHLVFRQILLDTNRFGDPSAIEMATRRYVASSFIVDCYSRKSFSLKGYIMTVVRSRKWKKPLLLGLMYSNPRLHRAVFLIRNRR